MQLPVFDTIIAAYRYIWQNRRDFAAFAFLPVLAVAIVNTLANVLAGTAQLVFEPEGEIATESLAKASPAFLLAGIVSVVVYIMFSVAWHRRYLLGPEPTTIGAALRWGPRQWRFLGRLFMLFAILLGLSMVVALLLSAVTTAAPTVATPSLIVAFFLLGLLYARLLLVFPAAAVDQPLGFRESAKLTKGNSWRMFGIAVLPAVPVLIAGLVIVEPIRLLFGGLVGPSISGLFVVTLLNQAIGFTGIAATVSALSIAYRDLTAQRPGNALST